MTRRRWELLTAVLIAAAGLAVVEAVQSVERPVRGVTDPGVVTTRQAITPAGVQSVFDGRVYGIAFGSSASELWVLTGRTRAGKAQLYRLDWLKNAVGGRWELEGAPALQGLAFDPERGSPLVGLIVPPRAVNNRAGGAVRLLARSVPAPEPGQRRQRDGAGDGAGAFTALADDLGRHLAGGPALRGPPPRRGAAGVRERAGDRGCRVGPARGPGEDRGRRAVRRGDQPRRLDGLGEPLGRPLAEGRRSDAADRHRADRRSRRRRQPRHRRDRDGGAHRSRDARGDGDGRRRPAPDDAGVGRGAPAALRRQRQQRFDLGGRHRGGAGGAHDRDQAVRPDARRRRPDRAGAGARRRHALRRARRVQRRRRARHRGRRPARPDPHRVVSEPAGVDAGRPAARRRDAARRRLGRRAEGSGAPLRPRLPRHRPCRAGAGRGAARQLHDGRRGEQPRGDGAGAARAGDGAHGGAGRGAAARRRSVADRARRLHHQGEPDLRSAVRGSAARQRRALVRAVRRGRRAEPSQAGDRVRPPRQLLRHRRQLRRRAPVGDAGERDGLCAVARLRRPQLPVRRHRSHRLRQHRLPLGPRAGAQQDRARLRRVRRPAAGDRSRPARAADGALARRRGLHQRVVDHGAAGAAEQGAGAQLSALHAERARTWCGRGSS